MTVPPPPIYLKNRRIRTRQLESAIFAGLYLNAQICFTFVAFIVFRNVFIFVACIGAIRKVLARSLRLKAHLSIQFRLILIE